LGTFSGETLTELWLIANEFAKRNNMNHNFNRQPKLAGALWVQGFLTRNWKLSFRKTQPNAVMWILTFYEIEVTRFYENLVGVFDPYMFGPNPIFNVDGIGFSMCRKLLQSLVI
jgi:hypothetical protein